MQLYNLYAEELGVEFGDQIFPKITELRKGLGIKEIFQPQPPVWAVPELSDDSLFLKTAFEDKENLFWTQDQGSIGPNPASKHDLGATSRSRSPSPDQDTYSLEKSYVKKGHTGIYLHDQPKLERIEENDESSMGRPDKKAEDSTLHKGSEVASLKEINEGKSEQLSQPAKNDLKLPFPVDGGKSPEDQNSMLLPSQGKMSPRDGKSRNKSKMASRVQTPSRSPSRRNSGPKANPKAENKPPPMPDFLKDDLPSTKQLVSDMLKKEYVGILQTIEIEDQFEDLIVDTEKTFDDQELIYEDRSDDESLSGSQAGLPVFGKEEKDLKEREKYEADLEQMLENNPNDIVLHYKVGALEIKKGEFSDKLKYHFTKVHKLDPKFKRHIVNQALGELYFKGNDQLNAKIALYFFKEAYSHDNTDKFHTLVRIGQCYSMLNNLKNAEAAYKRVV